MSDTTSAPESLVTQVANAISTADLDGPDPEKYWEYLARAAIEALRTPDIAGLIERLLDGVKEIGLHEDNSTELFDIETANETMYEAATALSSHGDAAVVAQIVAWLRAQIIENSIGAYYVPGILANQIARGDYRTTPVEPDPDAGERS